MSELQLFCFGFPRVRLGERPVEIKLRKALALLVYLALHRAAHSRDVLATLLWPESGQSQARASLRRTLHRLQRALELEAVRADADTLRLNPALDVWLDIEAFQRHLAEAQNRPGPASIQPLTAAADLYRADFLAGFDLPDCPEFEDWQFFQRESLRRSGAEVLQRLAQAQRAAGELEQAIHYARRWLAFDPLHEPAQRELMQLYASAGQLAAALRQYEQLVKLLQDELQAEPEAQTTTLWQSIRSKRGHDAPAISQIQPKPAESNLVLPELRPVTILSIILSESPGTHSEHEAELIRQQISNNAGLLVSQAQNKLLVAFGVPTAHSDDMRRAVKTAEIIQCGLTLNSLFAQDFLLQAQIGIASGQASVSQRESEQWLLTGNVVNLAQDLAERAGVGECWLSDPVYRAVATLVRAEPVASQNSAWRLQTGVPVHTARPLVGRKTEQHLFSSACDSCLESQRGQPFLLRGDAGIGKTRLVEAFTALAAAKGFACHRGLVLNFGVAIEQGPVCTLTASLLGLPMVGTIGKQMLQDILHSGLLAAEELEQKVFLNDLLELDQTHELKTVVDSMDQTTRRRGRRALLTRLLQHQARQQAQLLIVEDIHWADPEILEDLAILAQAVNHCPALLVMTTRAGEPLDPIWFASLQDTAITSLELRALHDDEAQELAKQLGFSDPVLIQRCTERAGGNPLFLEQLLYAGAASDEDIPDSIQSVVWQRLDRLEPADKQAVQAAAVLGQQFSLDTLRYLIATDNYEPTELIRRRLLRPQEKDFRFAHALIMEGIYASLALAQRQALHRRAAEWYREGDTLLYAEHLERAEDPQAAQAYLQAARVQLQGYHFERALTLISRDLGLARDAATRFALTLLQAETQREAGLVDNSIASYEQALSLALTAHEHCQAWTGLALSLHLRDRYADALQALQHAEAIAQDRPEALARIYYQRGRSLFPLGRIDDCLDTNQKALHFARKAHSPELQARALSGIGDAYYQRGQMLTAQQYFEQCVEHCREHGLRHIEGVNLAMSGFTSLYKNQLKSALEQISEAIQTALAAHNKRAELITRTIYATVLTYAADWTAAQQQAEQALQLSRELRTSRFEAENAIHLSLALNELGKRSEAQSLIRQGYQASRETGLAYAGAWVLGMLAWLSDDSGEQNWALTEGETLLRAGSVSHSHLHFYQIAIDVALSRQDWPEAERYASALEAYTQTEPLPWSDFFIARGRVLAVHGKGQCEPQLLSRIKILCQEAEHSGLQSALPALQAALAAAQQHFKS